MRPSEYVTCQTFPCADVRHEGYAVPDVELRPETVSIVLVSEAAPADASDYYYAPGAPLFEQTTVQAFRDAGADVSSIRDLIAKGVYFTTAVKCGKTGYTIKAGTINECSNILQQELDLFPNVRVLMLMGDAAIKGLNAIARRAKQPRVIPAGSTYKIRGPKYTFRGVRAFPSYLQAGPAFFVERSKREMIAQDIRAALKLIESP